MLGKGCWECITQLLKHPTVGRTESWVNSDWARGVGQLGLPNEIVNTLPNLGWVNINQKCCGQHFNQRWLKVGNFFAQLF